MSRIFITLTMDRSTKVAEVCSHLHKKVFKLQANSSFYLFSNKSMVTLNQDVGHLL